MYYGIATPGKADAPRLGIAGKKYSCSFEILI
jgi:hypothetical protein